MTKKIIAILLSAMMVMSVFVGCGTKPNQETKQDIANQTVEETAKNDETIAFVDSCGREVQIPKNINRIAPSGNLAQLVLYTIVPDRIIGWCKTPSELIKKYMPQKYWNLPQFGQFYGKNANLNIEALISAKPDIIIDIGQKKGNIKDDLDGMQEQVGVPVIFVEATLDNFGEAYKTLGELLGEEEQAQKLADYCTTTINTAKEKSAQIPEDKRVKVYYGEGNDGLQTNPKGSIHADVIDIVGGKNVADIKITKGGGGNQINMEQLLLWAPDVIIFGPDSIYNTVEKDTLWNDVTAVQNKEYYEIPCGPYHWLGRPPSVNRIIGIKWLGNVLYPDVFDYDMVKETKEFYSLFYHYELSDQDTQDLLKNSIRTK